MVEKHRQWFILGGLIVGFFIGYIISHLLPGNGNPPFTNFLIMAAVAVLGTLVIVFFRKAKR